MGAKMKLCNKCQVEKPFDSFSRSASSVDGVRQPCKDCRNRAKRISGWRGPSGSTRYLPKGSL